MLNTGNDADDDADHLIAWFNNHDAGHFVVALSGGVDSTVVLAAAARSGKSVIGVTAISPAVPVWQVDMARSVADHIGVEHRTVTTNESERPEYQRNHSDRCFFCKQTLYHHLQPIAESMSATIVSGTNADDLGDHRPGIDAGRQAGVAMPLADLRIGKLGVRSIAATWRLPNADLPAAPCLASRIAYHVEVTPERLQRIERAEFWLRERGFSDLRVRLHADELARIEVPTAELPRVIDLVQTADLVATFRSWGFRYVSLDLAGLRSGNLNDVLLPDVLVSIGGTRHDE